MPKNNSMLNRPKNKIKFLQNKNVSNFLTGEEGKIMKKDLAKLGLFIIASSIAVAGIMKSKDVLASCSHGNHASHGSHGSHNNAHWNSHGSHGSHNSGW